MAMNILFVDSKNSRRGPTAEAIYKGNQDVMIVKSAGTDTGAKTVITAKLLLWADVIFLMERNHKQKIAEKFPLEIMEKEVIFLDIEDKYEFMDPALIEKIKAKVDPCLVDLNT